MMRPARWQGWLWVVLFLMMGKYVPAQSTSLLDSLERLLPQLAGKEKMNLAGELAYQFALLNTDKALRYAHMELSLAQQHGDSADLAMAWSDLGAAHTGRGEFEQALPYYMGSIQVRARKGDSLRVAHTSNKLGVAWLELGVHDRALEAFQRTARIYEAGGLAIYLPNVYNNMGSLYLRQGDNTQAMAYLKRTVSLADSVGDMATSIAARINIAGIRFEAGDCETALPMYVELIRQIRSTQQFAHYGIAQMNLGACLVASGDYMAAKKAFLVADSIYTAKNDVKGRTMVQVNRALAHIGLREFDAALPLLDSAAAHCTQINSELQWYLLYDAYYRLESARGDAAQATHYFRLANDHRKRIYSDHVGRQIAEMETKYETEKKEQALQNAALRNRNQQIILLALLALFALGLIALFFVFRNARLRRQGLEQRAVIAVQEERLRISRDLHDHLGAELTLIAGTVEAAEADGEAPLAEIGGYARTAMAQLRETVWAIRSETISVDGFAERLRAYAERLCAPARMQVTLDSPADVARTMSPTVTLQLYRLCQEAIHNAVKYSQSPTLAIRIQATTNAIQVTVTDAGVGFDVEGQKSGYGIGNMRARASECGGEVTIRSRQGAGTEVMIALPW